MKGWYYLAKDGAPVGPFTTETLARDSAVADEAEWDRSTKVLVEDAAKLAKAEVGYSPGKGSDRCARCVHYYRNTCQLVEGEIDPAYWCKKFEAQQQGVANKGMDMKIATDPPVSEAQRRAMWSAKSGNSNIGIPASVGKEFANADPGGKLPAKAKDAPALDFLHIRDLNKVSTPQLREFARRYEQMNYADKSRNGKAAYESVQAELQRRGTSGDAKPPTAAGTMYVAPDGDILMMRRSGAGDKAGHWAFPGGRIEADESPQDAARREAKEEMGDHAPDGDSKLLHAGDTYHTFAQPVDEKFTPELNEEHTGFCWAPFNQLPSPLHPGVADMLRDCSIPDAAADMTPKDWQGLTGGLLKFLSEEAGEPEHAEQAHNAKPSFKQFARPRFKQFGNPKSLKAFS